MAAWNLEHLTGSTWYIPAPANIGIYCDGPEAYIIDSGNDKESGRQVKKLLDNNGWKLKAIINTHSHADHIGGNEFLQKRTACSIHAPAEEAPFISFPSLEPIFLWGGYPHPGLKTKLLQAPPSRVTHTYTEGPVDTTPLIATSLPGHSFSMMGVITPDDVYFLADSLISEKIIAKYQLYYLHDIRRHLDTINRLELVSHRLFLPSHGTPIDDVSSLIQVNRDAVLDTASRILDITKKNGEISLEELTSAVCDSFSVSMNHIQFVLMRSTISSYVSWLIEEKHLTLSYIHNKPFINM